MVNYMSVGTDPPTTDISTHLLPHDDDLRPDPDFSILDVPLFVPQMDDHNHHQNNLDHEITFTSKLHHDWGHIDWGPVRDNFTYGNRGGGGGGESRSVDFEAPGRTSAFDTGMSVLNPNQDQVTPIAIANENVENSPIHHMSNNNISLSSEPKEADEGPSRSENDCIESEPGIDLKDETCEINFQAPKPGMVFSSEEEAYEFYKNYATQHGFRVRKGKVRRLKNNNISTRYLFCSKEGSRLENQSGKTRKYKREETRTGCGAMIRCTHDPSSGQWRITLVVLEHNHELKGHPSTNISKKGARLDTVSKTAMGKGAGVGNSVVDTSNYLCIEKTNFLPPKDGQSLLDFFTHLQLKDPNFFYTAQLDAQSRLINIFWRDGTSKEDYKYFGDVLILDTTIRVEKYDLVCALFFGLNHHRQYVLFGCAFLLDDSTDSFVWLFRTFKTAMANRPPNTIFTDEGQAVSDAIQMVLSKTQHRLGRWYISQNARKHLSEFYERPGFEDFFNRCIFCRNSEDNFQFMWKSLLAMYSLQGNSWLNSLYMKRKKWLHVFGRGTFSAGLESLQEFKNITNVFHDLASETIALSEFAQHYQRASEQRRRKDLEDIHCDGTELSMILENCALEKQAADVYTCAMFKLFQEELHGWVPLAIEELADHGGIVMYRLIEEEGHREHFVEFNCSESQVTCSCKKYESIGILCVHALKVLDARHISCIPSRYILKRWTKSAKVGKMWDIDHKQQNTDEIQGAQSSSFSRRLIHKASNVITKDAAFGDCRRIVENYQDRALKDVDCLLERKKFMGCLNEIEAGVHYRDGGSTKLLNPPCSSQQEIPMPTRLGLKRKKVTEKKSSDNVTTHAMN